MGKYTVVTSFVILLLCSTIVYAEEDVQSGGPTPAELEAMRQLQKGTSSMRSKKYEEAIECFEKAVELKPEFTEAYYNIGISYIELGKHKDSAKVLKRVIQLDPDNANAYYGLGYAYYSLKKYDDALTAFKHSIELKPDNAFAHSKIGLVYTAKGNRKEAMNHYRTLKTLDSRLADELYLEISKLKQ